MFSSREKNYDKLRLRYHDKLYLINFTLQKYYS